MIPPPLPLATAAAPAAGFAGALLGESLSTFRTSSPAAGRAPCAGGAGGTLQCRLPDLALGGPYAARNLTLTFTNEMLTRIEFSTSDSGLDWVTARFRRQFGDPVEIVRDRVRLVDGLRFPHVKMTWRVGDDWIEINDPSRCGRWLKVRLGVGPLAPPPAATFQSCNSIL